jgi:hypothetical protein
MRAAEVFANASLMPERLQIHHIRQAAEKASMRKGFALSNSPTKKISFLDLGFYI